MPTTFPGSGSTRGVPPKLVGGGGGGGTPLWTVTYEVDLTAASTATWVLNADKVALDGVDWTAQNITGPGATYTSRMQLVNGVGFQIEFNGTCDQSNLDPSINTAPRIEADISAMVPGLAGDDTIACQILAGSDGLTDDWQQYGMAVMGSANRWMENSTAYLSGNFASDLQLNNGGRWLQGGLATEPGFREMVWYVGACGFTVSADNSTSLIDPLSGAVIEASAPATNPGDPAINPAASPATPISIANGKLCLLAYYWNAAGPRNPFTATWTKVRVLKRSK